MGKPRPRLTLPKNPKLNQSNKDVAKSGHKSLTDSRAPVNVKGHVAAATSSRLRTIAPTGKIEKLKKPKKTTLPAAVSIAQILTSGTVQEKVKGRKADIKTPITAVVKTQVEQFMSTTRKTMKIHVRSKKERQVVKKEIFRKKVENIKAEAKTKRETKARQKTVIVGDMRPILDALPAVSTLDEDLQRIINEAEESKGNKTKRKMTMRRRQEEIAQGLKYFAANLNKQT